MKNIREGISIIDLQKASGEELLELLEEIIIRDKYGNADIDNPNNDVVLYQQLWIELKLRLDKSIYPGKWKG